MKESVHEEIVGIAVRKGLHSRAHQAFTVVDRPLKNRAASALP